VTPAITPMSRPVIPWDGGPAPSPYMSSERLEETRPEEVGGCVGFPVAFGFIGASLPTLTPLPPFPASMLSPKAKSQYYGGRRVITQFTVYLHNPPLSLVISFFI
jgi:hypothetical protein